MPIEGSLHLFRNKRCSGPLALAVQSLWFMKQHSIILGAVVLVVACGGNAASDAAGGGGAAAGTGATNSGGASGSGTGGSGTGGSGTGGSGTGGVGTGATGSGGTTPESTCDGGQIALSSNNDPRVQERVVEDYGKGTAYLDHCDEDGNLISYTCEIDDSGFEPLFTGSAIESVIGCLGACSEGACPSFCPPIGETVKVDTLQRDQNGKIILGVLKASGKEWRCDSGGPYCNALATGQSQKVAKEDTLGICTKTSSGAIEFTDGCSLWGCILQ